MQSIRYAILKHVRVEVSLRSLSSIVRKENVLSRYMITRTMSSNIPVGEPYDRVSKIVIGTVAEKLKMKDSEISAESRLIDDLNMNSLDVLELVMAMEEHFDVSFPDDEASKFKIVDDVSRYIIYLKSEAKKSS